MVHKKHVIVGHMFSNGFTVIDVANPSEPKPVKFISNGPHTRSHHLQVADDLLLVANGADIPTLGKYNPNISYYQNSFADGIKGAGEFAAGLRIYDVANPATPREIAFLEMPGIGINRLWYVRRPLGLGVPPTSTASPTTSRRRRRHAGPAEAHHGRPLVAARHVARRRRGPHLDEPPRRPSIT